MDLGWASRERGRGEAEDGGSALTDGSGGNDCDDEDGCGASGEESGESHVQTNIQTCMWDERNKQWQTHAHTGTPLWTQTWCKYISCSCTTQTQSTHIYLHN